MKAKHLLISTGIIIILLCMLNYAFAPATESFDFSSINPVTLLAGFTFLFSFCFGIPIYISIAIVITLLLGAILLLAKVIQKAGSKN